MTSFSVLPSESLSMRHIARRTLFVAGHPLLWPIIYPLGLSSDWVYLATLSLPTRSRRLLTSTLTGPPGSLLLDTDVAYFTHLTPLSRLDHRARARSKACPARFAVVVLYHCFTSSKALGWVGWAHT